jgi:hypothetical protein
MSAPKAVATGPSAEKLKKDYARAKKKLPQILPLHKILEDTTTSGLYLLNERSVAPPSILHAVLPKEFEYHRDSSVRGFCILFQDQTVPEAHAEEIMLQCYAKDRGYERIFRGAEGSLLIKAGRIKDGRLYTSTKTMKVFENDSVSSILKQVSARLGELNETITPDAVGRILTSLSSLTKLSSEVLESLLIDITPEDDQPQSDLFEYLVSLTRGELDKREAPRGSVRTFVDDYMSLVNSGSTIEDVLDVIIKKKLDAQSAAKLLSANPNCRLPLRFSEKKKYVDNNGERIEGTKICDLESGELVASTAAKITESGLLDLKPYSLVMTSHPHRSLPKKKGGVSIGQKEGNVDMTGSHLFQIIANLNVAQEESRKRKRDKDPTDDAPRPPPALLSFLADGSNQHFAN